MKENWKTTLAGVVALVSVIISHWFPEYREQWFSLVALAGSLGLIAAADAKRK